MFEIRNEAERATVYIYGTIGDDFWSPEDANRAKDFAQQLDGLEPKPLDIRIDSAGGDVYEGFAIASAIKRYGGETHAFIDGMAASAASYIALMADRVTMNDYAVFMIHNAWTIAVGNRDELRDMAGRLESLDDTIAGVISARSALEIEEVKAAMAAETWYGADEALAAGMCDEVLETEQRIAACVDRDMARHFKNIPEGVSVGDLSAGPVEGDFEVVYNGNSLAVRSASQSLATFSASTALWQVAAPEEGGDAGASHALPIFSDDEARDAEGAVLLGNRVYRKEN